MTCGAVGVLCKLLVEGRDEDTPATFDAASTRFAILTEGMSPVPTFSGQKYGAGEVGRRYGAQRTESIPYEGIISLPCSRDALIQWLPRALFASNILAPASDHLPLSRLFDMLVHREDGVFRYDYCLVNEMVIHGRSSEKDKSLLTISLHIVSATSTTGETWPDPEPGVLNSSAHIPYTMFDSSVELIDEEIELPIDQFSLSINNRLFPVMNQSVSPQKFRSMGREINLSGVGLFNDDSMTLLNGAPDADFDILFSLGFGPPGTNVAITLRNMQNTGYKHPPINGPDFLPLSFRLTANKPDISTSELSTTFS
jgi:hypothetical protein